MSYAAHMSGDCGPGCDQCANECARCLQWLHECDCPTMPPALCDWHDRVVGELMADTPTDGAEKARADVTASFARACEDCKEANQ